MLPDSELIRAYLADLDKALRPFPADERAEIRTDIIEHLSAAIGSDDSPKHIAEVLTALGPVTGLIDYESRNTDNALGSASLSEQPIALLLLVGLLNAAWTAFFFPTIGIPISLFLAASAGWALRRKAQPRRLYQLELIAALLIALTAGIYLVLINQISSAM